MHKILGGVSALLLLTTAAFAGDDDGKIKSIDRETMMIVLDNGNSYKLPGEFDMEAISEGMEVVIAYDDVNGQNLITDMELYE